MERQPKDSGSVGEGNGKGANVSPKARDLVLNIKDLQKDVKELSALLKEIKNIIKQILKEKNNKIPGIK